MVGNAKTKNQQMLVRLVQSMYKDVRSRVELAVDTVRSLVSK